MQVCLICEEQEGWGGIGTYTAVLARGLAALGHGVHVITRSWEDEHVEEAGGVTWHYVPLPEPSWRLGTRTVSERLYQALQMLRWGTRAYAKLSQLSGEHGIELVEAPDFHAQALRATVSRAAPPVVVKLHTPAFVVDEFNAAPVGTGIDRALSGWLERTALRRAALVASPSQALADRVMSRWPLARPPVIVPHPIDEQLFDARSPPTTDDVLFVGRLERVKGVETLIDAVPAILASVSSFRLTLVGDDDQEGYEGSSMAAHLRARLADHAIPEQVVQIVGAVPRHELPRWYEQASVCVVPSAWEGFPYAALEAMSCGRPVVASAVGGLKELLDDGVDGLLVRPADSGALAGAIVRLLGDSDLRRVLGGRARDKVERRYSQPAACAAAAGVYERVLAERASRRAT